MTKFVLLEFDESEPLLCSLQGSIRLRDLSAMEEAGQRYCASRGMKFCIARENSTVSIRIRNLQFLLSFEAPEEENNRQHRQDILNCMGTWGPVAMKDVLTPLNEISGMLEELQAVWWAMVANGILLCDLDHYLTPVTKCTLNEDFRSHCMDDVLYLGECDPWRIRRETYILRKAQQAQGRPQDLQRNNTQWLKLGRLENPFLLDPHLRKRLPTSVHGVAVTSLIGATLDPGLDCPLQRDLISRLMFDHEVTFEKPSCSIPYRDTNGRVRHFKPDLLIHFVNRPSLYCVVANPARPVSCKDHESKKESGHAFAAARNCLFDIFDETRIRTQRLRNIQFLWERWLKSCNVRDPLYSKIIVAAGVHGPATRQVILHGHPDLQLESGSAEELRMAQWVEVAWWTLVSLKILRCDLDEPLTEGTVFSVDQWECDRHFNRYAGIPRSASVAWFDELFKNEETTRAARRLEEGGPI